MAIRPIFIANPNVESFVDAVNVNFKWFPGFSKVQKQKSIISLHNEFSNSNEELRILEVSSKSENELGVALSAFNLLINTKNNKVFSVETAFQSSKVFEDGGPYKDLLEKTSIEAKKDQRIRNSGKLKYFQYFNRKWDLEPKTFFYDWLYINALSLKKELSEQILNYDAFSDIEFNPVKSINCQAKSAALYVSLHRAGKLDFILQSTDNYHQIMNPKGIEGAQESKGKNEVDHKSQQLNFFDFE